jgi:hypothetical protein
MAHLLRLISARIPAFHSSTMRCIASGLSFGLLALISPRDDAS